MQYRGQLLLLIFFLPTVRICMQVVSAINVFRSHMAEEHQHNNRSFIQHTIWLGIVGHSGTFTNSNNNNIQQLKLKLCYCILMSLSLSLDLFFWVGSCTFPPATVKANLGNSEAVLDVMVIHYVHFQMWSLNITSIVILSMLHFFLISYINPG